MQLEGWTDKVTHQIQKVISVHNDIFRMSVGEITIKLFARNEIEND